ncbi:MAG: L-fuculose-phosphate aldolase [Chloroflexota bacterium]|jgi:L-fuculose-phosphate aldolase|nr:L-fuculose-phosphate aldolase [Chloroflexota bacterium]
MEDVAATRAEIVRVARLLADLGLAVGTSGNVGARLADGRIAITPSTMAYDDMTGDDVVIVEPDGSPSEGRHRPSSELRIHLEVFAARPDVAAIVHTHSPAATSWSVARRDIPAVHYVMALLVAPGRETIRVAPYATFGTADLARNAVATLGADHAVLLANHGAVAVAGSLAAALGRAERIEELAMLAWRAEQIGGPTLLTAAQLDEAREQMARFPRQSPWPHGPAPDEHR